MMLCFLFLVSSVGFYYMPDSLFPSFVGEAVFAHGFADTWYLGRRRRIPITKGIR
jgi:hypothetical protein